MFWDLGVANLHGVIEESFALCNKAVSHVGKVFLKHKT